MKTRIIKRKGTLLSSVAVLSTAMLLTACGGDGGDSPVDDGGANPGESGAQALLYAYPDNGQGEISTAAPVVLRFSSAVNLGQAQNSITLYEGDAQTGTVVDTTPESVAKEPNNVLLQPDEDLKPNQTYTVVIEDLRLRKGTAKDQTLTFTTRPLHEGPKNLVVKDDTFEVSRRMPDGSEMEPVMDFSSFRFQFTQPVDRATANYGEDPASTGPGGGTIPADSVVLRNSSGAPVPATLLIDGAYMTVDPDVEYLNAGETYTLDIMADLASTYGEAFGAESYTFTPKDSSPGREPAILVQKLTQGSTSRLTGKPVNEVPVNGTLLGENKNITQASAEVVRAELADVTTYTDVTPIRLPKGTVLNGAEINPILIGGEVDAGFGSGDVTMTVLSDASGYLVPNPYAENNPDALRIVHLLMDVGISTSEARANGAFTQDLLHIELVGLAEVDPAAGVLNLDAVSVVEPNILGQEYGYGMLSFQLQSYRDQNNPPQLVQDETAPTLQSWIPGQQPELFEAGDPIVLNFDEPLDRRSTEEAITLYENGQPIDINHYVDGSALVVIPEKSLTHNSSLTTVTYELQIGQGITDLAGNELNPLTLPNFELPTVVNDLDVVQSSVVGGDQFTPIEVDDFHQLPRAPLVLSAYPGYPCVFEETTTDLANDDAGRCAGGFPGWDTGSELDIKPEDDHIPVMPLPANRPIVIQFSKPIDANSVNLGGSFLIEEIDTSGNVQDIVSGEVEVKGSVITFRPLSPWKEGALYRYVLRSNGDMTSDVAICDGTQAICGERDGLPLQTRFLSDITIKPVLPPQGGALFPPSRETQVLREFVLPGAGGPDMVQYFRGAESTNSVLQVLSSAPVSDTNANLFHDADSNTDGIPAQSYVDGEYAFDTEEFGPSSELDPHAGPLDPNGLLAPPNSTKILSKNREGLPPGQNPVINGGNVGCGYSGFVPNQDVPGNFIPVPLECPEDKFTYVNGALVAEVTDQYIDGKGIKVLIWPGRITSTSLNINANLLTFPIMYNTGSGPQILSMRFAGSDQGGRNEAITGWIKDVNGEPTLTATVDLYVDAPYIPSLGAAFLEPTHNFISYPITMNLSGPVSFLDDGRMKIEQYNVDPVDLYLRIDINDGSWGGFQDLVIPEYGSRLQYVSEPIK